MVRYLFAKRFIDLMFSFIGLMLSTPIILLFALLMKLETPGPAFYMQERVGKDGVYFKLWKLRSMRIDAESGGAKWAQKNDPRITKVGAFIRKTRIDELPQFIDVLKGRSSAHAEATDPQKRDQPAQKVRSGVTVYRPPCSSAPRT
ncbi:hypothetical protein BSAF29S_04020 [Bacillus safensis subsp. safensis]